MSQTTPKTPSDNGTKGTQGSGGCGTVIVTIAIVLAVVGLIDWVTSSEDSPSVAGGPSDYAAYDQTSDGLADITLRHENSSGLVEAGEVPALLDEVESYASSQEGVASVSRGDTGVLITYDNGLMHAYLPPIDGAETGLGDVSLVTLEPFHTPEEGWGNITSDGAAAGDSAYDSVAAYVAGQVAGCSYTLNADDSSVSLSALASLSPGALVVYNGHGGYDDGIGEFLTTGETFGSSSYDLHRADFDAGRLIVGTSDTGPSAGRICVTSAFFDDRYQAGDLDSCTFYLGACYGLRDERLASALCSKGADLVVGYDDSVAALYDTAMFAAVMGYGDLVGLTDLGPDGNYLTWGQAIANAKATYGETDPYNLSVPGNVPAAMRSYPAGAADGLRLATAAPASAPADSEEGLRDVLDAATGGAMVNAFTRADYDSDGTCEAFAVVGGTPDAENWEYTDAELWYVSTSGATLLETGAYGYCDGSTDYVATGSPYSLYVHDNYGSRGDEPGCCRVYGVQDGSAWLMGPSRVLTGLTEGDGGVRFVGYTQEGQINLELDTITFELDVVM